MYVNFWLLLYVWKNTRLKNVDQSKEQTTFSRPRFCVAGDIPRLDDGCHLSAVPGSISGSMWLFPLWFYSSCTLQVISIHPVISVQRQYYVSAVTQLALRTVVKAHWVKTGWINIVSMSLIYIVMTLNQSGKLFRFVRSHQLQGISYFFSPNF